MDKDKSLYTMRVFDEYEKRFAKARIDKELEIPTTDEQREKIIADVKKVLKYKDELVPTVHNMEEVGREECENYSISQLRYETWDNFYSAGTLYMPHGEDKVPLVFVFCGHSKYGRLSAGPQIMADRLANLGYAVMVPDNIGQGDRAAFGHWDVVAPFYCGTTVQGMILMESVALIKYMIENPRIDKTRVGACGNSGGGTLTLFLAALGDDLTALCSSGYPSEFSYIHTKEKNHCHCNLLPGCANGPEMWEIYSTFAPRHLMIEQGEQDALIPHDMFMRTGRKIAHAYLQNGVKDNFRCKHARTIHSWHEDDRILISQFFVDSFGSGDNEGIVEKEFPEYSEEWSVKFPETAITTDQLAEKLTGIKMPENTKFEDVFKPTFEGESVDEDMLMSDFTRGDIMKILAQMECALKGLD